MGNDDDDDDDDCPQLTKCEICGLLIRLVTSSTSPSIEPCFFLIHHSLEIRSLCLWVEVLSSFCRRNSSTFGVTRERTTSRTMDFKLVTLSY